MLDLPYLQELLQPIVGQPLSGMHRALGQVFEFGERRPYTNRHGKAVTLGDLALKFITADWRVVQAGKIIVGSSDRDADGSFFDGDTPEEIPYNLEARRVGREFLRTVSERKFVAESIEVGPFADVTLLLSHGLVIQSFSSAAQDHDVWFFHNRCTDVSCLVGQCGPNVGDASRRSKPRIWHPM